MNHSWSRKGVLCTLVVFVLTGCGNRTYPISGKVVFADSQQPARELAGYLVTFESVLQPVSATGLVRDDASFEMSTYGQGDGALVGKHRVVITAPVPTGDAPPVRWLIDRKYGAFATSGLTIDVAQSRSDVVFEVERSGKTD